MELIGIRTVLGFAAAGIVIGGLAVVGELTPNLIVQLTAAGGAIGLVGDVLYSFANE